MTWADLIAPAIAFLGVAVAAWLALRGKKGETKVAASAQADSSLASRFDDASDLARYVREQVEAEVERQVAPIRKELAIVKAESHEMNDAVRARETQLWMWEHQNRPGNLPTLPPAILHRLGLGHLIPPDALGDTIQITRD